MWQTIYDAQAGLCTHSSNSKICVQILQKAPFWNFKPESPPKWKTSDLSWPKFTQKYPPPPTNGKLQIWDDQSLLRNTPQWKNSDLRWPKFTLKYPPPPMENFRFEMTKVYSEIPPWMAWNPGDRMWRLICIPRGYHSLLAWLSSWLVGQFVGWLICGLVGWLIGPLVRQFVGWVVC